MNPDEDTFMVKPSREGLVSRARLKELRRLAGSAGDVKARQLYEELYGATPAASLPIERVRASIVEACDELLNRE